MFSFLFLSNPSDQPICVFQFLIISCYRETGAVYHLLAWYVGNSLIERNLEINSGMQQGIVDHLQVFMLGKSGAESGQSLLLTLERKCPSSTYMIHKGSPPPCRSFHPCPFVFFFSWLELYMGKAD